MLYYISSISGLYCNAIEVQILYEILILQKKEQKERMAPCNNDALSKKDSHRIFFESTRPFFLMSFSSPRFRRFILLFVPLEMLFHSLFLQS